LFPSHKCKFFIVGFLCFFLNIYTFTQAQSVFTSIEDPVYSFLDRMSLQGKIVYHDEVRPLSRIQIAQLLQSLYTAQGEMNQIEKENYSWYCAEFAAEMGRLEVERAYLYKYRDTVFHFTVSPLAGYEISKYGSASGHHRWWGAKLWGTYADYFAGSFEYRDNTEYGDGVDRKKLFSPQSGYYITASSGNSFDYSDVKGGVSLNWKWGSFSIIKDYMNWGHGNFGQIILSSKAPDFPQVRLILQPTDWLRLYYTQGWLNSMIYDSSRFYYNYSGSLDPTVEKKYIDKYFVANMFSVTLNRNIDFSLGNSFVYGGSPRLETFIPFMYYKVMDHNTGRQLSDDGNGMIFSDIKINYPASYKFYGTLLIDALNIRQILKGIWYTSWFAFTVGAKKVDVIIPNLDLNIEYTQLRPWIYENHSEISTYKHMDYVLGDWMGQNADELSLQFIYKPVSRMDITITCERIRKGGIKDISYAYKNRTDLPFLYSPLRKEYSVRTGIKYEVLRDAYLDLQLKYSDISDEDSTRTFSWMLGKKFSFAFSLKYGL
jgi:hypothetical protein